MTTTRQDPTCFGSCGRKWLNRPLKSSSVKKRVSWQGEWPQVVLSQLWPSNSAELFHRKQYVNLDWSTLLPHSHFSYTTPTSIFNPLVLVYRWQPWKNLFTWTFQITSGTIPDIKQCNGISLINLLHYSFSHLWQSPFIIYTNTFNHRLLLSLICCKV